INGNYHQKAVEHRFFTTANPEIFQEIASIWLKQKINVEHVTL
ncbi:TPA: glutamate racemase, partial [Streptococcus pyogenes]